MYIIIDIIEDEINHKKEWIELLNNDILSTAELKLKNKSGHLNYSLCYKKDGVFKEKKLGILSKEEYTDWLHKINIRKHQFSQIPRIKKEIIFLEKLLKYAYSLVEKENNSAKTTKAKQKLQNK